MVHPDRSLMPLPAHTLPIAGVDYPNRRRPHRREELERCSPGELVTLQPEPTNPADPHAVAVISARGVTLGYLPADRAPRIAALLGRGRMVSAIFQGTQGRAGFIRIAYDGAVPTLPTPP